jgi:hypothetical protein
VTNRSSRSMAARMTEGISNRARAVGFSPHPFGWAGRPSDRRDRPPRGPRCERQTGPTPCPFGLASALCHG